MGMMRPISETEWLPCGCGRDRKTGAFVALVKGCDAVHPPFWGNSAGTAAVLATGSAISAGITPPDPPVVEYGNCDDCGAKLTNYNAVRADAHTPATHVNCPLKGAKMGNKIAAAGKALADKITRDAAESVAAQLDAEGKPETAAVLREAAAAVVPAPPKKRERPKKEKPPEVPALALGAAAPDVIPAASVLTAEVAAEVAVVSEFGRSPDAVAFGERLRDGMNGSIHEVLTAPPSPPLRAYVEARGVGVPPKLAEALAAWKEGDELKAVSFARPWLWAILHIPAGGKVGPKRIENREKRFPDLLRLPVVALHSSQTWDAEGAETIRRITGIAVPPESAHPTGIVGLAHFAEVYDKSDLFVPPAVRANPWFFGPYGHVMDEVVALPSVVECSGKVTVPFKLGTAQADKVVNQFKPPSDGR